MNTQLMVQPRETLALPTGQWFDEINKYRGILQASGFNLHKLLESTLQFVLWSTANDTRCRRHFHAVPVHDYQNFLTQWLMEMDAKFNAHTPADFVAVTAEVSTHFYHQLTELFKDWNLTAHQVRNMSIKGWVGDDMLVEVYI